MSTLQFIEDGLNVCILGPSDSGKTFLAKSLGVAACEKYRVNYCHCSELLERLVATKSADYTKYLREIKKILGFQLLILDDFLLNTIMDEREVKVLMEILEKRIEASKSTIVCFQREPGSWKATIMNDEILANYYEKGDETLHCCHSDYRNTLIRVAVGPRRVAAVQRKLQSPLKLFFFTLSNHPRHTPLVI